MISDLSQKKYIVLTGNYGSGKTEIALNLALHGAPRRSMTLVDLDIVNPYFRSGEKEAELKRAGVKVLMPVFAMTTVDIPALPPEIQSVFESSSDQVIFDVGGDDTGAAALGRYYPSFMKHREQTALALVVNCMRPLTRTADDILDLAQRIQQRGRLKIDLILNNTNLGGNTTPEMIETGEKICLACAQALQGIPLLNAGNRAVLDACRLFEPCIPVVRYMKPEWMEM